MTPYESGTLNNLLGNSMIIDPLLLTVRAKNYGGKNRDKGWKVM